MIQCSRPSRTGLFEIFGSVLVEGDCVTPNREHFFLMAILPTAEAAQRYIELHSEHTYIAEVHGPANYIERYKKWKDLKFKAFVKRMFPRPEVDSSVPF